MQIKRKRTVVNLKTYVACDGKEFQTEMACLQHEHEIAKIETMKQIDKFRISELNDVMPISDGCVQPSEYADFAWYNCENKEVFDLLTDVFEDMPEPLSFPETICVENIDGDCYYYFLSDLKKQTINFWNKLGYTVAITKKGDDNDV